MSSLSSPTAAAGADLPPSSEARPPALVEWGDEAIAAQAAGALKPAWKKFIKTKFYVAILRSPDDDPRHFLLHLERRGADGAPVLIASEVRDRLDQLQGDGTVALSGADLLRRLGEQGAIEVALRDATFTISKKRVEWLRSGIEETKARVVIRKILQAAAPAAPLPVLRVASESQLELAPVVEDEAAPRMTLAQLLAWPYFKPAAIGMAALALLAGVVMALGHAPEPAVVAAPPQFEAPLPQQPVTSSGAAPVPQAERALTFAPPNNSFSVSLPGLAEEVELSPDEVALIGHLPTNHYRLLFDGVLYRMEATDYITRSPEEVRAEMDARQNSVVGKDGRLLSVKEIDFAGAKGREVRVRMATGGVRAARFVFVGSRLSMVTVTAENGEKAAPRVDAFLDSFKPN